ncbi:MAG: thiamine pyrophosphate-dependent dehydrogenase E1 component subunit alpha [Desulfatiglandales bacterium]
MNKNQKLPQKRSLEMYRKLMTIRLFEEKVDELFRQGKIPGAVHTSVGQEAVAVGVAEALNDNDTVMATHRGHGHCLMRGAEMRLMMAELYGKATGLCKGKGGSMHIVDLKNGMLGANGIVGAGLPLAAGVGLAIQIQKTEQVCVCFFGDAASNGGPFHEALNVAAVWKLPVVFVCENNRYGISVSIEKSTAVKDISVRAMAYDIPGETVDGMDVAAVYKAATKAVDRARSGKGPSLLECKCYRFLGHSRGDPSYGPYRTKEELEAWQKRDPRLLLIQQGRLANDELEGIDREISDAIDEAVRYAEESPLPDVSSLLEDVYA